MVQDILLLQEVEIGDKYRNLIWRVPAAEFLLALRDYEAKGFEQSDAKTKALVEMISQKKAEYIGVTDDDAELFAANLREEGLAARYVKSMKHEDVEPEDL